MDSMVAAALLAALIGGAAAAAELAARYKDDPLRALVSAPSALYMLFNAAAAFAAVYLLDRFAPKLIHGHDGVVDIFAAALLAGFGSLSVMRMSVIKLRVGADEVSVGPALVIEQVLRVVDRSVDRLLAVRRAELADELSERFNFDTQGLSLVAVSIALLQNASAEEQTRMTEVARALMGRSDLPSRMKAASLVLALLGLVGERVLRSAIDTVSDPPAQP